MTTAKPTAIAAALAHVEAAWTNPDGVDADSLGVRLTALTEAVVATIADRGRPGWEEDRRNLRRLVSRLWHRLPEGADRSETHRHGALQSLAQALAIAIEARADDAAVDKALATPAVARILKLLVADRTSRTSSWLRQQTGYDEATISRHLKTLNGLRLVLSVKRGRELMSSALTDGVGAVERIFAGEAAPKPDVGSLHQFGTVNANMKPKAFRPDDHIPQAAA